MTTTQVNLTTNGSQEFAASVLLFEDDFVDRLNPMALCRPAHTIACGGYHLSDIVERLGLPTFAVSHGPNSTAGLRKLHPSATDRATEPCRVLLNACLAPDVRFAEAVRDLLRQGTAGAIWDKDRLLLAILPNSQDVLKGVVGEVVVGNGSAVPQIVDYVRRLGLATLPLPSDVAGNVVLLDYPHSVIAEHHRIFASNLADRIGLGDFREISPGVFVQEGVTLGEYVVSDTSRGPIVCESGATVGPFSFLAGPLLIESKATVHARTTVHPYVWLGKRSKIGGEVESTIIEPYSNKQHHGYLGHSYVGSWVNLGAGTSNSNLKNTYGQVNMVVNGRKVATGMRLMGCVIGDYTKSAINTSILTGRTIGAASMLYGLIAQDVPSFVNYAHQFGDVTAVSLESAVTTQRRMFERRNVQQQPGDEERLARIYKQTEYERVGLDCRPPRLS